MRISQMLHFPLEGAGTGIYVDGLSQSLTQRGHQISVLCSDHYLPKKKYPVVAVLFSNGTNDNFELDFDFPVFASHPLSRGPRFGELSKPQREAYFHAFHRKIKDMIASFSPDIIHVHHGMIIASIVAEFDIPYVITLHGTEYYGFKEFRDYQELTLRGIHGAHTVITPSDAERERAILTYGIDSSRVVVVKHGTDTNLFRPIEIEKSALLADYSIQDVNRPVIFFGGRLTSQKGVDTLIKAARIYSQMDEKMTTIIAGDGDLRQYLEKLAKELDTIYFIGTQSHQQMAKLFNVADVVVVPSVFEPFGLTALEALGCGTPVIASNVGGLRQIVNKQVGCLIEPGDYRTLALKVTSFIRDGLKEKVRFKAADYIRRNFSWEETNSNIERVYGRVNSWIA